MICIGSNINKEQNVPALLDLLHQDLQIDLLRKGPILETPAVGPDGAPSNQNSFFNMAVLVAMDFPVDDLRTYLRAIENRMGRQRTSDKFAPRPIDLDIAIFWDANQFPGNPLFIAEDIRTAPHVAVPIGHLLPEWIHPRLNISMRTLAEQLSQPDFKPVAHGA